MEKEAWRPKPGDRVSVDILIFGYQGDGSIADVSTDYERGKGTKLYPRYLVEFDDGTTMWVSGKSLTRV